ncbi:MAG: hypothetical protein RLY82_890 [Pseudomonadota bacterium]
MMQLKKILPSVLFWIVTDAALAEAPSFKLTVGSYNATGGDVPDARGTDLNLRSTSNYGNTWVGWYKQDGIKQWRTGWDNSFSVGLIKLQPSLQAASGGFWGGSFGVETGEEIHKNWYVGAGIGRTNLRPYVNLNFDPNDALMASGGYRFSSRESLGLQWVRDNRLNIDQRNVHLVYRKALSEHERLTLDAFSKTGSVGLASGNTEKINKFGLSVGYDWREYFVKVSYDPRVNFTTQNMLRLSVGTRF